MNFVPQKERLMRRLRLQSGQQPARPQDYTNCLLKGRIFDGKVVNRFSYPRPAG